MIEIKVAIFNVPGEQKPIVVDAAMSDWEQEKNTGPYQKAELLCFRLREILGEHFTREAKNGR